MKPSVACSSAPEMPIGCRKPCLPSVVSGEQVSFGRDAFDGDGGAVGREGLVLDIAGGLAVDRVGEIGAELFDVGLVDAAADFFVRREQNLDGAMFDLRIVDQELRRIHDLGDTGLVVRPQQRGAVRRDDVMADLVGQRRMLGGADDLGSVARQHDIAAAIISQDLRFDVLAAAIWRSVHMRAEADYRDILVGSGRDRRIDIAVRVEMGVANAHRQQFTGEQRPQFFLLFGGRTGRGGRIGLGIDDHVAQETLGHAMDEFER
jgi:hypothetical protein